MTFNNYNYYNISISGLYEHRVLLNGKGDIKTRKELFKTAFRIKLNNWWSANASKILAKLASATLQNTQENQNENNQN